MGVVKAGEKEDVSVDERAVELLGVLEAGAKDDASVEEAVIKLADVSTGADDEAAVEVADVSTGLDKSGSKLTMRVMIRLKALVAARCSQSR